MIGTFSVYALLLNVLCGVGVFALVLAVWGTGLYHRRRMRKKGPQLYLRLVTELSDKDGRWRWFAYDESGELWTRSPGLKGYATEAEAIEAGSLVADAEWNR